MEPVISIIVPVYNEEPYLEECVRSIRKQTLRDIEIILIDDGSPDSCPRMCDQYLYWRILMKGLHDLCIDALGFCFMRTLLHTDFRWTRKERPAWLRELAEYDWVKAAQGHDHATLKAAILLHWMKKGSYRKINLYCRVLRPFIPLSKRSRLRRR